MRFYMNFPGGRKKALTLSYDDGVKQDERLVKILDKNKIKCTFNINSGLFSDTPGVSGRMTLEEAKSLYMGTEHEVAIHALNHPHLEELDYAAITYEVSNDRLNLECEFNTIVRGMAYPFGTYNEKVLEVLKCCGIAYSRTVKPTYTFSIPQNWLELNPTCHHNCEKLDELCNRFLEADDSKINKSMLFYLWGHSYEFDNDDNWDVIEKFAEKMGGHENIWYATNIEIYDYCKAFEKLVSSQDGKMLANMSALDLYFRVNGKDYALKSGETLRIAE